jgi:hypothetical protein
VYPCIVSNTHPAVASDALFKTESLDACTKHGYTACFRCSNFLIE